MSDETPKRRRVNRRFVAIDADEDQFTKADWILLKQQLDELREFWRVRLATPRDERQSYE